MNRSRPSVLVVGAGIAGCATALALGRAGWQVTLIEKQDEWRFQSSGIFVYGNGLESLRRLGVLPGILEAGYVVEDGRNIYLDHRGEHIVDTFYPRAGDTGEAPPIVGIRRADLHRVLAAGLASVGVEARLSTTVAGFQAREGERVPVTLSNGGTHVFDLVVGADGIRSGLRAQLMGEMAPRYTGLGVWRSVHARPASITAKIMQMGIGKRLGIMPISRDQLYLFGTVAEPKDAWYPREQWPALMRERFAEFDGPARDFIASLSGDSEVLYTAVEEVAAPLPWHRGRVLLIGDAVHASTPFMGQGGAMALEDAIVLSETLTACGNDVDAALTRFGEKRYPVCKFVQDASRRVGEGGAQEDEARCALRNAAMKQSAQAHVDDFYGELHRLRVQAQG